MDILARTPIPLLEAGMDACVLRHEIIAQNLANADTPGYKRKELLFEELFPKGKPERRLRLETTHPRHISNIPESPKMPKPVVVVDAYTSWRNDENNVDVEVEAVKMVQNYLRYEAYARAVSVEVAMLRSAVSGGRR